MRKNADLRNAGWGPLRWPSERRWIREAEALVDRELARWVDPAGPTDSGTDGSAEGAADSEGNQDDGNKAGRLRPDGPGSPS